MRREETGVKGWFSINFLIWFRKVIGKKIPLHNGEVKSSKLCLSGLTQKGNVVKAVGMKNDYLLLQASWVKKAHQWEGGKLIGKFSDSESISW